MLKAAAVALLVSLAVPAAPPDDQPVKVDRNNQTVDVNVRYRGKHWRHAPTPSAPDAPAEFDEPCAIPSHSPARYVPSCLAGAGDYAPPGRAADVVDFALEARAQLALPLPTPTLRPLLAVAGGGHGGVTGAPVWLWTDQTHWSPGGTPLTRRAQAGPVWAVVSAAAVRLVWHPGDGSTVTCSTAGTPLTSPAQGLVGSPDCGYTYRRTSAHEPDGKYQVTVSVIWAVTWLGSDGSSGALAPLTTTTTIPYPVVQARAQLVAP